MRNVLISCRGTHNNSYLGGIVSIIKAYFQHSVCFEKNGYEIEWFQYHSPGIWEKINSKLANVIYIFQQRRALKKELKKKADVILHIHTSREFLFLKDVALGKMAKRAFGVPVVLTIHVGDISTVFNRISVVRKILLHWMNRYFDKVIFLSNEMKQQFVEYGLSESKTDVLYNFHAMEVIEETEQLKRNARLHLIYVGAIHKEKGIMELLSAVQELDDIDYHLDICGKVTDKSIENSFHSLVNRMSDKITFWGYVTGKEKTALFNRADILLLPSYHEGMPLVVLEGMSQGCALIATQVGATPEILSEKNVSWIEVGSVDSIRNAICKFYLDSDLLSQMQSENKKMSAHYTLEEHVNKLCSMYREL